MISISDADFDAAVGEAIALVPDEFRPHLENVIIEVQPRPDRAFCRRYDVPDDILGFYVGVPVGERSVQSISPHLPDRILIFRDNLCEMCESREDLIEEIRVTVLHEIGHHFGLDEDRLDQLGYA